ncbi:Csp2NTE, partial [Eciton burchellii]
ARANPPHYAGQAERTISCWCSGRRGKGKSPGKPSVRVLLGAVFLLAALALFAATAAANESDGDLSRSRVSDEQLNIALSDKRYLTRQLKCALGEAPCDPVGRRLKSLVPLVLRGSCPQCNPEETRQIKKVLSHIQRSFPKEWNKIVQQYAGVS